MRRSSPHPCPSSCKLSCHGVCRGTCLIKSCGTCFVALIPQIGYYLEYNVLVSTYGWMDWNGFSVDSIWGERTPLHLGSSLSFLNYIFQNFNYFILIILLITVFLFLNGISYEIILSMGPRRRSSFNGGWWYYLVAVMTVLVRF